MLLTSRLPEQREQRSRHHSHNGLRDQRREGHRAVVAVYVYRAHTDEEVVLRKEGERGARHVTDGDDRESNQDRPFRAILPHTRQDSGLSPAPSSDSLSLEAYCLATSLDFSVSGPG